MENDGPAGAVTEIGLSVVSQLVERRRGLRPVVNTFGRFPNDRKSKLYRHCIVIYHDVV